MVPGTCQPRTVVQWQGGGGRGERNRFRGVGLAGKALIGKKKATLLRNSEPETPERCEAGKLVQVTFAHPENLTSPWRLSPSQVVFTITEATDKVHIPLLLSPYSYTTYRGS